MEIKTKETTETKETAETMKTAKTAGTALTIVAYNHVAMKDSRDKWVSDWSRARECCHCGRAIVHVYTDSDGAYWGKDCAEEQLGYGNLKKALSSGRQEARKRAAHIVTWSAGLWRLHGLTPRHIAESPYIGVQKDKQQWVIL